MSACPEPFIRNRVHFLHSGEYHMIRSSTLCIVQPLVRFEGEILRWESRCCYIRMTRTAPIFSFASTEVVL